MLPALPAQALPVQAPALPAQAPALPAPALPAQAQGGSGSEIRGILNIGKKASASADTTRRGAGRNRTIAKDAGVDDALPETEKLINELSELYNETIQKGHPAIPSFGASVRQKIESLFAKANEERAGEVAGTVAEYLTYFAELGFDSTIVYKLISKIVKHPEMLANQLNGQNAFSLLLSMVFSSSFAEGEQGMIALIKQTGHNIFEAMSGNIDVVDDNFNTLATTIADLVEKKQAMLEKIDNIKKQLKLDPQNPNNLISLLHLIKDALDLTENHSEQSPSTPEQGGALAKLHKVLEPIFSITISAILSIPFRSSYDTTKDEAIRDVFNALAKFCPKEDGDLKCTLTELASLFGPEVTWGEDQTKQLNKLIDSIGNLFQQDVKQEKNEYKWKSGIYTAVTFGLIALAIKNAEQVSPTIQKVIRDITETSDDSLSIHPHLIREVLSRALVDTNPANIDKDSLAKVLPLTYEVTKKILVASLNKGEGVTRYDIRNEIPGTAEALLSLQHSSAIAFALTVASCSEAILEQPLDLSKEELTIVHAKLASEAFLKYLLVSAVLSKATCAYKEFKNLELGLEALSSNSSERTKELVMQLDDELLKREKPVSKAENWDAVTTERNNPTGRITLIEALLDKELDDTTKKYLVMQNFLLRDKVREEDRSILENITFNDVIKMGHKGVEAIAKIKDDTQQQAEHLPISTSEDDRMKSKLIEIKKQLMTENTNCISQSLEKTGLRITESSSSIADQLPNESATTRLLVTLATKASQAAASTLLSAANRLSNETIIDYKSILQALSELDIREIDRLQITELSKEATEGKTVISTLIDKFTELKTLEPSRAETIQKFINNLERKNAIYIEKDVGKVIAFIESQEKDFLTKQERMEGFCYSNKSVANIIKERFKREELGLLNQAIARKVSDGAGIAVEGGVLSSGSGSGSGSGSDIEKPPQPGHITRATDSARALLRTHSYITLP